METDPDPVTHSRLAVWLVGPPRIERDGVPVDVDTRKATALLAYLLLTAGGHRRDTLASLLWPDYPQERARAALRRTLSVLRKALDGGWITTEGGRIDVSRDGIDLDVERFHRLAVGCEVHSPSPQDACERCLDAAREAAEVYGGEFMAGFSLRDSAEFDDWQAYEADGLRRTFTGVLARLVRDLGSAGEIDAAIGFARRWLQADPLSETAHRELMRLYAWAGDRTAALRQYRECVSMLERELGVPPLPETTELYQAIRENQLPQAPQRPVDPPSAQPIAALPIVGREHELDAVEGAYDEVGPDGRFVVVEGEAGVGKTRLVTELLARLGERGAHVLMARCHPDESGIAYGPIGELLRGAGAVLMTLDAAWLTEVGRLVAEIGPGTGPEPEALDEPGARARFFEGIARGLCAGASPRAPGVLFVDDLHWADEASVEVLSYLVRRLKGRPVCVVAAWRTEDVERGHRLRRLLSHVRRSGGAVHVVLSRLDASDVQRLVSVASPQAPVSLGETLWEETEGLPLFVVEYLASIGGSAEDIPEVPRGVRDLLRSRLDPVSQQAWQVLSTAAVVGRSFDLDVLREASGRSDEEIVLGVEELLRRGLVADAPGGDGYDFTHEKMRAFVYEETSLARRRLLHARVAESLRRRRQDVATLSALIARHYLEAGQQEKAAEHFRLAGDHARSLSANAEALMHLREALALGHPEPAALHEAIGDLLTLAGDYPEAVRSYETAAALAPEGRLAALEHRLGLVHHRRGDWVTADSHLEAALAGAHHDPGRRARTLADRSLNAHRAGRPDDAVALADRALAEAEAAGDEQALAQAHNIAGMLASRRGELDRARAHLERSLTSAEERSDTTGRIAALNNLALTARTAGDLAAALELTGRALELCTVQGDRHRQAALHNNLADLHRATGDTEEAMEHLKQAVAIFADVGEPGAMEPEIWKLVEW